MWGAWRLRFCRLFDSIDDDFVLAVLALRVFHRQSDRVLRAFWADKRALKKAAANRSPSPPCRINWALPHELNARVTDGSH